MSEREPWGGDALTAWSEWRGIHLCADSFGDWYRARICREIVEWLNGGTVREEFERALGTDQQETIGDFESWLADEIERRAKP